ncbi:acetyl-hydrolase [Macrophomina phaseolina]|uniref:Acetyl-hydrolase n=1 Tax=Macrophomina phaseolina TaxID=35725 RepID=A0ABQ8G5J9_9PEZI|nr:acetyl-hydrolase [Macrophomina phaseolina]
MADMPASALAGLLIPKLPMILKTALLNTLSMSSNSGKWDLRTELTIEILRSELGKPNPASISEQQRNTNKIPEVKGPMWVSKVTIQAPPEDDVRQRLLQAIDDMKTGGETYTIPPLLPVEGEWHGHRTNAFKDTPEISGLSEEEKYKRLVAETTSDAVVLFFHAARHRPLCQSPLRPHLLRPLSPLPQNPFPAALLDALVAYLSLLYPPPGSYHAPVPASKIILAGDSAGGNLALVLMQTLLQWHRAASPSNTPSPSHIPTLSFHGADVPVPLPGGMALASPWADLTRALPSQRTNARYDYLPGTEWHAARYPPCPIWPATPPRAHLHADGEALLHPLVSPVVPGARWEGCPPVLVQVGQEMMSDESAVLVRRMEKQGVSVRWMQFEAMPHCFALVMEGTEMARCAREAWGEWAREVVGRGEQGRGEKTRTKGEWIAAKSLAARSVDVRTLTDLSDERAVELMREVQLRLIEECKRDAEKAEQPPVL